MRIVAGVDFGTLSTRVTLLDSERGRLGTASAGYPLHRKREDPDFATQSHDDQMAALAQAMREVLAQTGIDGAKVEAIALDTTGSSVIPVDAQMQPLDDYYLWCDHRALHEAKQITALAHARNLEAIEWCGGVYSHEWGFAKLLHWLRNNPDKREQLRLRLRALRHGGRDAVRHHRPEAGASAASARWATSGCGTRSGAASRRRSSSPSSTRCFDGVREKLAGEVLTSDHLAGHLSPEWAEKLGLRAGIPIPVGAFDAHWDAIGAGCREGDVVNVVGTSPPASSPCSAKQADADSGRVRRGAGQRASAVTPASRRGFRPSATSSKPSPARRHRRQDALAGPRKLQAPGRPACCA